MSQQYTNKQREILEISTNYIAKNGMLNFSLRNIAQEIGIKQASIYSHFNSKEEILRGIFELYKQDVLTYYETLEGLNTSKFTKLKMYFLKMSEFIQYKPEYMNLVWFEIYQYRDLFKDELNFVIQTIIDIINNTPNTDENIQEIINYEYASINIL